MNTANPMKKKSSKVPTLREREVRRSQTRGLFGARYKILRRPSASMPIGARIVTGGTMEWDRLK